MFYLFCSQGFRGLDLLCEESGFLCCLLFAFGRDLAVCLGNDTLKGAKRAGSNTNTAAVNTDGLEVNLLGAAGRDV